MGSRFLYASLLAALMTGNALADPIFTFDIVDKRTVDLSISNDNLVGPAPVLFPSVLNIFPGSSALSWLTADASVSCNSSPLAGVAVASASTQDKSPSQTGDVMSVQFARDLTTADVGTGVTVRCTTGEDAFDDTYSGPMQLGWSANGLPDSQPFGVIQALTTVTASVPEPSAFVYFGLLGLALGYRRWRSR